MKKRLVNLLFASLFLTSCSNSNNDTATSSVTSGDTSSTTQIEEHIPGRKYDDSPTFSKVDDKYISQGENSFYLFDDVTSGASIDVTISKFESGKKALLIFNFDEIDSSYYAIGLSSTNKIEIFNFDGSTFNEIKLVSNTEINDDFSLKINIYKDYNFISACLNDEKEIEQNLNIKEGTKIGFYSETKDTTFSEVNMKTDVYDIDNIATSYHLAYGNITFDDGVINVKQANSLFVNDNKTMSNGIFEYTFKSHGNNVQFGCVFALDDKGETQFWRNKGVSYYFLGVGITGSLNLYKCVDGSFVSEKYFIAYMYDDSIEHTMKIVKFDNIIDIFLDGKYQFSFQDSEPLKGKKVGFCSMYEKGYYKDVKITPIKTKNSKALGNIQVCNGEFKSTFDIIRATEAKSLALVETPMTSSEGTIRTTIGSINQFGQGIVFNLTKPNKDKFYESESGLSYYWFGSDSKTQQYFKLEKWNNGVKTQLTKLKYVALSIEHGGDVKIVLEGKHIYCYFANRLIIDYIDNDLLTGRYYGFKSEVIGGSFSNGITYEEEHNVEKSKYLIFGHSYTHLWLDYKKDFAPLGSDDVLDVGIGGASTWHYSGTKFDTIGSYITEMADYESEWGIYWNGINDIDSDQDLPTMSVAVETTMTEIHKLNPKFKCVVVGINLCTYSTSMQRIPQIKAANIEYKRICDKYDYLEFVDVETLFCDSQGNPQASCFIDNLHPTKESYRKVAPLIIEAIKNHE